MLFLYKFYLVNFIIIIFPTLGLILRLLILSIILISFIPTQGAGINKDSIISVSENSIDRKVKVTAMLSLSKLERELNASSSIDYAKKAIEISKKIEDKTYLIKSYAKLGLTYRRYDSLDRALEYLLIGLDISKEIENEKWQATCLNHLGSIYLQYGQNEKALDYYKKSYLISKSLDDSVGVCNSLNNIGIIFWQNNQLDSSFKYLLESLILSIDLADSTGLISSYNNLGMLQTELGDYLRALGYYNQALIIAKSQNDQWETANILNNRANLSIKSSKLDSVEADLKTSLEISKVINSKLLESDSYLILSEYYKVVENFNEALIAYKKYSKISMELINLETSKKLAGIQKDYEVKAKDQNLEKLSTANNIQYHLILLLATTLSLLGIFVFIYFRKFTENKTISNQLSVRNKELEKLSESKSKFFTLISHDLKAPLYNVSNLSNLMKLYRYDMDEKEKDETLNQLNLSSKHLLNLVDNILLWASAQIGNLENEPKKLWLDSIISESMDLLAPMAKEKGINMNYEQNNLYVIADYNLLSTSIRNLMSNAVKFSNSNSTITISATQNNEYVDINVKDEGIGIECDRLERILSGNYISDLGTNNEKGSGLGLKITKEFIELNGGILTGESTPDKGSNFIIRLPKK